MRKATIFSLSVIGVAIIAWFGLPKLIDQLLHSDFETDIAGDYYVQATSDTYRAIYNRRTGFSIPMRVDWYGSDAHFIAVIRKQETNLDSQLGPCEYYVIDHMKAVEYSKLTEKGAHDLLQYQPELSDSFGDEMGKRCNAAPNL